MGRLLQFSIEHPCTSTPGSSWVTDQTGVETAGEPYADEAAIARHPGLDATRTAPLFLHLRCRNPVS
jgi:hypothetical protein